MRLLLLVLLATACDPGPPAGDAGPCAIDVAVGTAGAGGFVPIADGDPVELRLGFQGFRMLRLALDGRGAHADRVEVSAFVSVSETGVELGQRTRERARATEGGFRVEEWLVFFNDEPPSRLVGRDAEIEAIVRAAGCTGAVRARVRIVDDEVCVDPDIVIDAGGPRDAGLADAATCEGGP